MPGDSRLFADGAHWCCHGPSDEIAFAKRELALLTGAERLSPTCISPRQSPPKAGSPTLRSLGGVIAGRPVPIGEEMTLLSFRRELEQLEVASREYEALRLREERDAQQRAVLEQDARLQAHVVAASEREERLVLETGAADDRHAAEYKERSRMTQEEQQEAAVAHLQDMEGWVSAEGAREKLEQAKAKVRMEFEEAERKAGEEREKERMHKLAIERLFLADEAFLAQETETERIRRLIQDRRDGDAEGDERARMRQIRIGMRGFTQGYNLMGQ
eukprot:TRINITY_DN32464_c0_g1_i1.p2 TRINITY_DN32464_c0_g1~~TRINITY_DN32464_c0_g1_i1.p2  ORF type:complete len:274 (+),score=86.47 TRINITY_DN32464_c0_g1_i1:66-887(+)